MFTGRGTTRTVAHPVELLTRAAGELDLKRPLVLPFFRMRRIFTPPPPREAPCSLRSSSKKFASAKPIGSGATNNLALSCPSTDRARPLCRTTVTRTKAPACSSSRSCKFRGAKACVRRGRRRGRRANHPSPTLLFRTSNARRDRSAWRDAERPRLREKLLNAPHEGYPFDDGFA